MNHLFRILLILLVINLCSNTFSQPSEKNILPEPVKFTLDMLNEAYTILDKHSEEVWNGWNDYLNYPFLLKFENGLQVLVGLKDPPEQFVLYPGLKIHGLDIYIDNSDVKSVQITKPLLAGGSPSTFQPKYGRPVRIVRIPFYSNYSQKLLPYATGEIYVLVYMHELFHCFQDKMTLPKYPNLFIVPDVEYSTYSEIEGKALAFAYKQDSKEEAFKYLKDFCIARANKIKNMKPVDIQGYSLWEFREGIARYSEYVFLNRIKNGFHDSVENYDTTLYHGFANADTLIQRYYSELISSSENVLEQYGKYYEYGCFQAILLDRYFNDWKKEIENGLWLHQTLQKRLGITQDDSLLSLQRFRNIYNIDNIRSKNSSALYARDETRKLLDNRKGRTYIIDAETIQQQIELLVDSSVSYYPLGTKKMYPFGTGDLKIGNIEISFKPLPSELYRTTNLRIIDTNPDMNISPYQINYQSVDSSGVYSNVIMQTPVFTLKAPKISVMQIDNTTVVFIKSKF